MLSNDFNRSCDKVHRGARPVYHNCDSKSLFDVITKCSQTQERRLMIDLPTVRDACKSHEISNVVFIQGPENPADGMAKALKCLPLNNFLRTGKANFKVEQWFIRSNVDNHSSQAAVDTKINIFKLISSQPTNGIQLSSYRNPEINNHECTTYYCINLNHLVPTDQTIVPRCTYNQF